MQTEEKFHLAEEILSEWKEIIGKDYEGYKNHVFRIISFCLKLNPCNEEDKEKIIIAACFHDLGIWTDNTVDYLPPSISLAKDYLERKNLLQWSEEIELIIDMHHKLTKYNNKNYPLVELFRRADLVDVSLGAVKWGLSNDCIRDIKAKYPNAGFHDCLNQLFIKAILTSPLNPLPMMKW